MVSPARSAAYHADSGYLRGNIIRKGGNVRKSQEQWLKKYIKLENGIPDACTFRNVIKAIDTQQLHTVFAEWMQSVVENITGVVAIDGKRARRTKDARKPPLHVVSAFSAECGLVLGQLACEEKSNVRLFFEEYRRDAAGLRLDCRATSHSQGHGRYKSWTRYVCEDIGLHEGRKKWSGPG